MSTEDQDFTQSYQPNHVLNLVFGKLNIEKVPYIEVWIKDPVSGTVTTKHFKEQDETTLWQFLYTTLRIMNLRNKVIYNESKPKPLIKSQAKSITKFNLNLDDLI